MFLISISKSTETICTRWLLGGKTVYKMSCVLTYEASMTTPTPAGFVASTTAWAICLVKRSCTGINRISKHD